MQRHYILPVTSVGQTNEISPGDFQVARIKIDNPSNAWLYITIVNKWVPPNTLGTMFNVQPSASAIQVNTVTAPPGGQASVATGGPIVATVYDTSAVEVAGLDFGLIPAMESLETAILTLTARLQALKFGWGTDYDLLFNFIQATPGSSPQTIITTAANETATVIAMQYSWDVVLNSPDPPRGYFDLESIFTGGGNSVGHVVLSPEHPSQTVLLPPQGGDGGLGQDLEVWSNVVLDSQSVAAWVLVWYYIQ